MFVVEARTDARNLGNECLFSVLSFPHPLQKETLEIGMEGEGKKVQKRNRLGESCEKLNFIGICNIILRASVCILLQGFQDHMGLFQITVWFCNP